MKKFFSVLFLFFCVFTNAQDNNSLLWKISGNGLEKDSYLFGTMHVSQKIAFHLDDIFYESLKNADFIALESDPKLWLNYAFESREMTGSNNYYPTNNFYNKSFELKQVKDEELRFFISQENAILNGLLYRSDNSMQDFEEETYLDMFIYQGGAKYGKKIYSLEDIELSTSRVVKASIKPNKDTPDIWLQKLLKDDNYYNIIRNAYRDRNIHLLDSVNKAMYSKNHMKNMLYLRNEEMADNMDTIMRKGSLFAGIGAAHLAGKEGVLNLLVEKGYTVSPLTSEKTATGENLKTEIENKFVKQTYTPQTSNDGFFTINLPNKLYELNFDHNTIYLSPDLTNGSYVSISKINRFDYFKENKRSISDIDKLLFENIPGKILSKNPISKNGFEGLDIVNLTKTGNYQRYQIFLTPLEIIIIKMGGKKDFVKNESDQIFDTLQFNNIGAEKVITSPKYGGYEIEMPKFHSFYNQVTLGKRSAQGYDTSDDSYYFMEEVILNDTNYLEEDTFELERIHERFYKNLDFEYHGGKLNNGKIKSFVSQTKINSKENRILHLKTIIKGGHYFLLGVVNNSTKTPSKFFNSFQFKAFKESEEKYKVRIDTTLLFSVNTTVKPKLNLSKYYYGDDNKKEYLPILLDTDYESDTNEQVFVSYKKHHDYKSYDNIDSLWNSITNKKSKYKNVFKKYRFFNEDKKELYIANKKIGKDANGLHQLTYLLKDSLSSRAIKVKNVLRNNNLYQLKTLIDTLHEESKFIREFYTTFTPKDTVIGKSLFEDKTGAFFKALKAKDSVAFKVYDVVRFHENNATELMDIISNFNFDENQMEIKTHLISELGKLKNPKVKPFLEKLYKESYENSYNQIAIFNAFAEDNTKPSTLKTLDLLEYDIPLTSDKFNISSMMWSFRDSLELSKDLFPELLNYAFIPEYKEPIYNLLNITIDSNYVKPSSYATFKKQLLTEAKIELKRQLSKKISNNNFNKRSYNSRYQKDNLLYLYTKFLFPFRKDENVANFLTKVSATDNNLAKIEYLTLKLKEREKIDKKVLYELAKNIKSRYELYEELKKIKKTRLFPKEFKTQKSIMVSELLKYSDYSEKNKDSLEFVTMKKFNISNKKYNIYFFKTKSKNFNGKYDKEWKLNYIAVEDKEDEIFTKIFHKKTDIAIDKTKKLSEEIDKHVESAKLKDRKRVNLDEFNYNQYNFLGNGL